MAALHWGVFDRHAWDGNSLALEPCEVYKPACGVRTDARPALTDNAERVTCGRCLTVLRRLNQPHPTEARHD
jgi:hypothetical protein